MFRNLIHSIVALLKEKREIAIEAIPAALPGTPQQKRRRPFLVKRIGLAIKLLAFLGCLRVSRNAKRQRSVVFQSSANVRNAVVGFLQNAQYTSKVDKKELREKLEIIFLKTEAERFIDRNRILKENGALFKSRTASFDLLAVDRFLQKNQNIVVPHTTIVLKRELHARDLARN